MSPWRVSARTLRFPITRALRIQPNGRILNAARWHSNTASPLYSVPRRYLATSFQGLHAAARIEEERWSWCEPDVHYSVRIGEVFESRYEVLDKLGHGARSTVWLGLDICVDRYVALKVCERNSKSAQRELAWYEYSESIETSHVRALLTRELYDNFSIKAVGGEHLCLVHKPLELSLKFLVKLFPDEHIPDEILRPFKSLLLALDCLHIVGKTVHADLQASNILIRSQDDEILKAFEEAELKNPSPRKIDRDRIIYQTREHDRPKKVGFPVLCDFGEARYGQATYTADVQPYQYRAPEVILDMP
nr:hypothetical protein B0A51_15368 [Rachicladosporium sp. CCFEE 5018]